MEELTILRTDSKSNVDFPTLGGWAPLTPELFKGQWYIYMCVSIYFIHTSVPNPLLPTSWAGVEANKPIEGQLSRTHRIVVGTNVQLTRPHISICRAQAVRKERTQGPPSMLASLRNDAQGVGPRISLLRATLLVEPSGKWAAGLKGDCGASPVGHGPLTQGSPTPGPQASYWSMAW